MNELIKLESLSLASRAFPAECNVTLSLIGLFIMFCEYGPRHTHPKNERKKFCAYQKPSAYPTAIELTKSSAPCPKILNNATVTNTPTFTIST